MTIRSATSAPVDGEYATATLTSDTVQPANGNSVSIGSRTYTFRTALTPLNDEVKIGASAQGTLDNLIHAIAATGGTPGTDYQVATAHSAVAGVRTGDAVLFTAKRRGAWANSVALAVSGAHLSWGGAQMAGGVNGTPAIRFDIVVHNGQPYMAMASGDSRSSGIWKKLVIDDLD